jgi:hypothetical protein
MALCCETSNVVVRQVMRNTVTPSKNEHVRKDMDCKEAATTEVSIA